MNRDDPSAYGELIADVYDEWHGGHNAAAIDTLHELARDRPVLELGIGTGRIALPLAQRGLQVHGIDASPAMVERLRAKQGGAGIPVTMGNFADVDVPGPFSLVFVAFNTFFALTSQEEQLRCFGNVAQRLLPNGLFVIEAFVPDVTRFSGNQTFRTTSIGDGQVRLEATIHDPVNQRSTTEHVVLSARGVRLIPVRIRYAWPAELDLMAKLAGLSLLHRWGSWARTAFTADSKNHISVYEKPNHA
ncbi:MAG TPA: class I SAM-dependent methyltransferase [Gemmatimonadaceae bacterium]|nr:class I SAM-dependent methyltransferase [Gemmatimonadaceae bacterium]